MEEKMTGLNSESRVWVSVILCIKMQQQIVMIAQQCDAIKKRQSCNKNCATKMEWVGMPVQCIVYCNKKLILSYFSK